MRNIPLAILIIGFCQIFYGQDTKYKTISLTSETSAMEENVGFYVANIIDNRFSKSYLGIVQIGLSNTRIPVKFEQDFLREIKGYLDVAFPKKEGLEPITIRINELMIDENTGVFTEEGTAKTSLDVLKPIGNNLFELLGRYRISSRKTTLDVTNGHSKRIGAVLRESLIAFYRENPKFESLGILNLQNDTNGLPFLREKTEGGPFYNYTFFELQNNRFVEDPSVSTIENTDWSKTEKVILKNETGDTPNYSAFFDGKNYYLNANLYSEDDYFIKTYRIDKFLLFNEMLLKDVSYFNDLAYAMAKSSLPYMQERNCFLLDLNTGVLYGINREKMKMLLVENFPDLYKLYKRYGKKDVQKVYEILTELFKKENAENIRKILAPQ